MRAFDGEVVDAVWAAIESRIPVRVDDHPKGGHRLRIADRICFEGILIRLVTGCAWVDVEHLLEYRVSDTTLRARRDEWITAGVFDALAAEALAAYDRVIGLDFSECAVDGSQHKAPTGGEGTGPSPPIGASRGGSGRCSRIATASRSAGRPTAPTVTTPSCWNQPSTVSPPAGCWRRPRP